MEAERANRERAEREAAEAPRPNVGQGAAASVATDGPRGRNGRERPPSPFITGRTQSSAQRPPSLYIGR
eukprot:scaffold2926_cov110-Isochrysis_galbana.AAC.6